MKRTMRSRFHGSVGLLALAGLLAAVPGCDEATPAGTDVLADGVAADTTVPVTATVKVAWNGQTKDADLSVPARTTLGGLPFVSLADVVLQAFPEVDFAKVTADFAASDGFKPGSSVNCATLIPVAGTLLAQGYISPTTRNLAWDEALGYPGCMRVNDTARIDLMDR